MSLNNLTLAFPAENGHKLLSFTVGHPFPLRIPLAITGGNLVAPSDGSKFLLNILIPGPNRDERTSFQQKLRFGLYDGEDMPQGLLLVCLSTHNHKGGDTIIECPFDLDAQNSYDPDSLEGFYSEERIGLFAILTNTAMPGGKVVAIKNTEMPMALVAALRRLWTPKTCNANYPGLYRNLIQRKTPQQIWREATKF